LAGLRNDLYESWSDLITNFERLVSERLREWVAVDSPHYRSTLEFAKGRLDEGRRLGEFFRARKATGRLLDIGAGNGGVSIGVANYAEFNVYAIDVVPNNDLRELRTQLKPPVRQLLGNGHFLPFVTATFDVVLCLETIEHVPRPDLLAREIMRILKKGGICMVTTPARLRYWFQRDPHYAIPALLLLPDALQRFVATSILRRTDTYDVEHIFWHVNEITQLFGEGSSIEVLWNRSFPTANRWADRFWFRFRNFMWDRILITKN
jgi:2-polyprenyl-3-methyl-5-hydroxy-6-metoxy-1,4-benzoquinol methylase